MRRRERSSSSYPRKFFPREKNPGSSLNPRSSAATGACTSITSSRPTKARTSTSSSARAAPSSRGTTTERHPPMTEQEHVLGPDGQFHVEDEAVDISIYGWGNWETFGLFWVMG